MSLRRTLTNGVILDSTELIMLLLIVLLAVPSVCTVCDDTAAVLPTTPGRGWDNLRNGHKRPVLHTSYTTCSTTQDGLLLIPDRVTTISYSTTEHTSIQLIESMDNFTAAFSTCLNSNQELDLSFLNGRYSHEFMSLKRQIIYRKTVTLRTKVSKLYYTLVSDKDIALSDEFKERVINIGLYVALNQTKYGRFLAESLVRDYGTNVITSVDVGTAHLQINMLPVSYVNAIGRDALLYTACQVLSGLNKTDLSQDIENHESQEIESDEEAASMEGETPVRSLRTLDQCGVPLDEVITRQTLPEIPAFVVKDIRQLVHDAIIQYYRYNVYPGCTDPTAPNFNFAANIDDGSCYQTDVSGPFSFGGVYQVCKDKGDFNICTNDTIYNPLSQNLGCGQQFTPILIDTKTIEVTRNVSQCRTCFLFFKCCGPKLEIGKAEINAYWCASDPKANIDHHGFHFSGLYATNIPNDLTANMSCPSGATSAAVLQDLTICMMDTSNSNSNQTIPFAGFKSCHSPNPYVDDNDDLKDCPSGYSKQLIRADDRCGVYNCIRAGARNSTVLSARSPPFMIEPPLLEISGVLAVNPVDQSTSTAVAQAIISQVTIDRQTDVAVDMCDDIVPAVEEVDRSGTSPAVVLLCWASTGLIIFTLCYGLYRFSNRKRSIYVKV